MQQWWRCPSKLVLGRPRKQKNQQRNLDRVPWSRDVLEPGWQIVVWVPGRDILTHEIARNFRRIPEGPWLCAWFFSLILFGAFWAKLVTEVGLSVWHTESKPLLLRDSTSDTKGRQVVKTVITLIQKTPPAPTWHPFSGATGRTCDSTISLLQAFCWCAVQKKADHQLSCQRVTSFKAMPKTSDLNDVASLVSREIVSLSAMWPALWWIFRYS